MCESPQLRALVHCVHLFLRIAVNLLYLFLMRYTRIEELHSPLEMEIAQLPNVKLVRGAKRLGAIRARIEALKHAAAPVRLL